MLKEQLFVFWDGLGLLTSIIAYSVLTQVAFSAVTLLLSWRVWAFTIHPKLHPQAPKELPYWIPVLGHARAFIKDAQSLIDYAKNYFGDSGEPFALTVGGRTLYILTEAEDVAAVYKNNTTLSWDAMLNDLLVGFGIDSTVIPKLWSKLPVETLQLARPEIAPSKVPQISAIHSTLDLYKRQLLPGPKLVTINDTLTELIDQGLQWKAIRSTYFMEGGSTIQRVSLTEFCSTVLVNSTTRTLFGDGLYQIEPRMTQYLLDFNQDAWRLVFKVPSGADSKLSKARKNILAAFVKYIQNPAAYQGGQSWLVSNVINEQRHMDISDGDRAALLLMIYWAANINPYRLAFWMLSYILFDPELLATLKAETKSAYRDGHMDIECLLNKCPKLEAAYQETLRIVNGALSARKIVAPTIIGGRTLSSPNTILIPYRQLQYNKKVFGNNPEQFDAERFIKDKSLSSSWNFKPFGGGVNYCPGRFLAKQEMLAFTALVLNRFDMSLSSKQEFPKLDVFTPALGINGTQDGMDLLIDIKEAA